MFAAILSVLGSSAFGSFLGAIMAFFNRKLDLQVKVQELAHEERRWEHDLRVKAADLEYARVEAASKEQVAFIEAEAVLEAARFSTIAETSKADEVSSAEIAAAGRLGWLFVVASAYRKSMRSLLTTVVGGAAIAVNLALVWQFQVAWDGLDEAARKELIFQALAWISAQASMMFGYWFVSRGSTEGRAK